MIALRYRRLDGSWGYTAGAAAITLHEGGLLRLVHDGSRSVGSSLVGRWDARLRHLAFNEITCPDAHPDQCLFELTSDEGRLEARSDDQLLSPVAGTMTVRGTVLGVDLVGGQELRYLDLHCQLPDATKHGGLFHRRRQLGQEIVIAPPSYFKDAVSLATLVVRPGVRARLSPLAARLTPSAGLVA